MIGEGFGDRKLFNRESLTGKRLAKEHGTIIEHGTGAIPPSVHRTVVDASDGSEVIERNDGSCMAKLSDCSAG